MAQAVQNLYPNAKVAIGPSIDTGFYYDFDTEKPFSNDDLAKIEKEMRNTVNRRVNCDAANLDKAVLASREQVEAFTRLTESGAINDLPVKLQEVAVARLLQPELTLSELAATFDPPLTKSCLNHRIRKLMEIAKKEENE